MTRVVLIRHGESNASVQRIVGGLAACTGLSELGRRQAQALAERFTRTGELTPDVLVSSTYRRAVETAEILRPALGGLDVQQVRDVGEHFPGPDVDGITFDAYAARYGMTDWNGDPYSSGFPGGETIAEFQHRVGRAMTALVAEHAGKTIVVVCHGGVIDAALRRFLGSPPTGLFEVHTVNTSVTEFFLVEPNRWRMIRYNDAAHLSGLPRETPRPRREATDAHLVELRPVTAANVDEVLALRTWPSQERFVAPVWRSLVDAHHERVSSWYRAAYVRDRPVGFVLLVEPGQSSDDHPYDGWFLWRLLIGGPFQRGGYGRRILELVCEHVASAGGPLELHTTWIAGDGGPEDFYLRYGFEATGRLVDGEVEARLARWPDARARHG